MTSPTLRLREWAGVMVVTVALTSCTSRGPSSGDQTLRPVTPPDLSRVDASIAARIRGLHATLLQEQSSGASGVSATFGELGKVYFAARFYDLAEACFVNAQSLAPTDRRWPYYLAHVYRSKGMLPNAATSFEQARALAPDDVPTLVWLGEIYLTQGQPDVAEPLQERALTLDSTSVAARFGLGRTALAKKDFAVAAKHLQEALALDPNADSLHYPLAMAYRGLGRQREAEAHLALRRQGDVEVAPTDPLMQEVENLVESPVAFEVRGIRALDKKDFAAAIDAFRKGLDLDPSSATLRHRYATALFMLGKTREAVEQFEEVVRRSPTYAKAHYSLGVLLETGGRPVEALDRYAAAVRAEPGYADARARLADLQRGAGRSAEALENYERILAADPRHAAATFGRAVTLVNTGQYAAAQEALTRAIAAFPEQQGFVHALARLLATAPDNNVRDGRRALTLTEELLKSRQTVDLGETMAMALAEVGQYAQAEGLQRELLSAARQQKGNAVLLQRLSENLRLYSQGRPCRVPWRNEPDFSPTPDVS